MKFAIIGAAVVSLAFALPASAQNIPDTPAVGTKSGSGATGYAPPNDMVNGSTSIAVVAPMRGPGGRGYPRGYYNRHYEDREAYLLNDPRYALYEELR